MCEGGKWETGALKESIAIFMNHVVTHTCDLVTDHASAWSTESELLVSPSTEWVHSKPGDSDELGVWEVTCSSVLILIHQKAPAMGQALD